MSRKAKTCLVERTRKACVSDGSDGRGTAVSPVWSAERKREGGRGGWAAAILQKAHDGECDGMSVALRYILVYNLWICVCDEKQSVEARIVE